MTKIVEKSSEYIRTETGNKICRNATIFGIQNIILKGKCIIRNEVIIRGDLRRSGVGNAISIAFGSYCYVGSRTIMKPPCKIYKGTFSYYPLKMGDHVIVGEDCLIEAASIGSFVDIGNRVIIGSFVVIKDCVFIEDDVVIPPYSVIPPFSVVTKEGIQEWTEGAQEWMEYKTRRLYHEDFVLS